LPRSGKKEDGNDGEGETGCSERGAARDEREMTGINGRYFDIRNSIGHKISRDRNKSGEEET